jgi:hypothetical protein
MCIPSTRNANRERSSSAAAAKHTLADCAQVTLHFHSNGSEETVTLCSDTRGKGKRWLLMDANVDFTGTEIEVSAFAATGGKSSETAMIPALVSSSYAGDDAEADPYLWCVEYQNHNTACLEEDITVKLDLGTADMTESEVGFWKSIKENVQSAQ